jgi:hypothetical protein
MVSPSEPDLVVQYVATSPKCSCFDCKDVKKVAHSKSFYATELFVLYYSRAKASKYRLSTFMAESSNFKLFMGQLNWNRRPFNFFNLLKNVGVEIVLLPCPPKTPSGTDETCERDSDDPVNPEIRGDNVVS